MNEKGGKVQIAKYCLFNEIDRSFFSPTCAAASSESRSSLLLLDDDTGEASMSSSSILSAASTPRSEDEDEKASVDTSVWSLSSWRIESECSSCFRI